MRKPLLLTAAMLAILASSPAAAAQRGRSAEREIPTCTQPLGTIAIVEPDRAWWGEMGLSSPEAVIRLFVLRSGCFRLVDRSRGLQSRNIERALAENGELEPDSNIGRGQVAAADYFLIPDVTSRNANAGGTNLTTGLGRIGRNFLGGAVGGGSVRRSEANVMLTLVNARTTVQERLAEGQARRADFGANFTSGALLGGMLSGVGASTYENTDMGRLLTIAFLDAYIELVRGLGGLPADASAAAPRAQ